MAKQKKQLGKANFDAYLAQQGLTEETTKKQIRSNMLLEYAVDQAAKKISKSDYKAALILHTRSNCTNYQVDSEDKAKKCWKQLKRKVQTFAQIAKDNSTDTATKDKGVKSSLIQEQQMFHLKSKKQPLSWMKTAFQM